MVEAGDRGMAFWPGLILYLRGGSLKWNPWKRLDFVSEANSSGRRLPKTSCWPRFGRFQARTSRPIRTFTAIVSPSVMLDSVFVNNAKRPDIKDTSYVRIRPPIEQILGDEHNNTLYPSIDVREVAE